jgi:hypothetical protein
MVNKIGASENQTDTYIILMWKNINLVHMKDDVLRKVLKPRATP